MHHEPAFGSRYLEERIIAEFALARHIGVVVERADQSGMVLSAPLDPNANYKGTAFGGSLYSLAVLGGWAWVTWYLAETRLPADAVIQESSIRHIVPVTGMLRAAVLPPDDGQIAHFRKMLERAGRGRIRLEVRIHQDELLAVEFTGLFAAALR
jgi:thioesterase domain-containing protein